MNERPNRRNPIRLWVWLALSDLFDALHLHGMWLWAIKNASDNEKW